MKTELPKIYASANALLKLARTNEQRATICEVFKEQALKRKKFEIAAIFREQERIWRGFI